MFNMKKIFNNMNLMNAKGICICCFLFLSLVALLNPGHYMWHPDKFSKTLIVGRLVHDEIKGLGSDYFMMGIYTQESTKKIGEIKEKLSEADLQTVSLDNIASKYHYIPYDHQIGMHAIVYSLLNKLLPFNIATNIKIITILSLMFSMFLAVYLLNWFSIKLNASWALIPATILFSFFGLFYMMHSTHLYWAPWTMLLPLVVVIKMVENEYKLKYYVFYFLAVAFRCGCGFELISTVLVSSSLPIFYQAYNDRGRVRFYAVKLLYVIIAALLAFFSVLALSISILGLKYGSLAAGVNEYIINIGRRTSGFADLTGQSQIVIESVNSSLIHVIGKYFISVSAVLFAFLSLITIVYLIVKSKKRYINNNIENGLLMSWIGAAACLSWVVLAKAHCYEHAHIIKIIWDIPFTFSAIYTCLIAAKEYYHQNTSVIHRTFFYVLMSLFVLLSGVAYVFDRDHSIFHRLLGM